MLHNRTLEQLEDAVRRLESGYKPPIPYERYHQRLGSAVRQSRVTARRAERIRWREIPCRDRGICYLCGKHVLPAERAFDHAISLANKGEHSTRNIRLTHIECNRMKGTRDVTHQMYLL